MIACDRPSYECVRMLLFGMSDLLICSYREESSSCTRWSKREEIEFMRVLRSYGVKDDPSTIICWTRFRQLSPLLEKKSDSELMEQLYCVLWMCTKQLGNEMSTVDLQRAMKVEPISARKAQRLMHRMNMMRQIHDWADSLPDRTALPKLCSNEAMPNGWSVEQDDDLFAIIRPEEKTLLRRVAEIYTTLQTKKWNGAASIELLEDSGFLRHSTEYCGIRTYVFFNMINIIALKTMSFQEEPSEYIIEKVMSVKKNEKGPDTYFVKHKNKLVSSSFFATYPTLGLPSVS
ncbi:unnamed protein product [Toxocara canis]|uniref:CDAN1-interacting nuclease 1 n=1 Tax=Toxocara canis TaxID=6265 RepID=A0A183U3T7_TOXCA|nr:unnamed protein product [Toxocara canis]